MGTDPAERSSSNGIHRLVAEGTVDLQTAVSVDGVYRFVSAAGAASFGWTPSELLGHGSPSVPVRGRNVPLDRVPIARRHEWRRAGRGCLRA